MNHSREGRQIIMGGGELGRDKTRGRREREVKGFYLLIISVNVELGFILFSLETVGNVYAAFVF